MKTNLIIESGMQFGEFDDTDLFHIENSKIYKELGCGVKTVEFILKYNENSILFLEAKESCPNTANRFESSQKTQKFEEYYSSITEKFIDSLQIYLAVLLGKYNDTSDLGEKLKNITNMRDIQLKFILVVKNASDVSWLAGPLAELKARMLKMRKIWNVEIAVLNEELAKKYGLVNQSE